MALSSSSLDLLAVSYVSSVSSVSSSPRFSGLLVVSSVSSTLTVLEARSTVKQWH